MERTKISMRIRPDLLDAGRERASEEQIGFREFFEDALAEKLGRVPLRAVVEDLADRVELLERMANREGATI
jgi:hypothetical protein